MKITKRQLGRIIREAWTQSDESAAIAAGWEIDPNVEADIRRDLAKDRRAEELVDPSPEPPIDPPHALDRYDDVQWDEDGMPYRWDEKGNYVDLAHLMESRRKITKRQFRRIIREVLEEDKSGKGKCPDTGCIEKSGDKWRIISNKTGKMWPQHYDTEEKAENALKAYHVHN